MSNLEIGYDEHEGKRRRHWWNKIFGLFFFGPIGFVAAGVFSLFVIQTFHEYPIADKPPEVIGLVPIFALGGSIAAYNGWISLMKDEN